MADDKSEGFLGIATVAIDPLALQPGQPFADRFHCECSRTAVRAARCARSTSAQLGHLPLANRAGSTPLASAAMQGHVETMNALLEAGAALNVNDGIFLLGMSFCLAMRRNRG
jgi:hypothetical protein